MRSIALIAPLAYLLLQLLFPPSMNGDALSLAAAACWGEPSPHLIYVGYLMSALIMGARMMVPGVEWFTVSQIALNALAIAAFAHCVLRRRQGEPLGWQGVLGLLYMLAYMVLSCIDLHYPWPGCAGMVAGFLLMLRGVDRGKASRFGMGLLLLLLGASMRYDSCPVLLPFMGMLMLLFILTRRWKRLIPVLVSIVVVVAVHGIQPFFAEVSLWEPSARHAPQNLIHVNDARMRFCDYVDLHDAGKEADYAALGLSNNDKDMITHFNNALEQRSRPQWWESIRRVRDRGNERFPRSFAAAWERVRSESIYRYLYHDRPRFYLAMMSLPLLLLLILPFPRRWDDARPWVALAALGAVAAMMLVGRVNQQGCWAVVVSSCGLALGLMPRRPLGGMVPKVAACGMVAAACIWFGMLLAPLWSPFSLRYKDAARTAVLHREFAANPGRTYVVDWGVWVRDMLPLSSLRSAPFLASPNAVPVGNWMMLLPSVQQRLQEAGVESDCTVLLHPEYRFVRPLSADTEQGRELRYMEEHHGLRLHYVLEKALDDNLGVYRVEELRKVGG